MTSPSGQVPIIPHRFVRERSLLGFGVAGGLSLFVVLTGLFAWLLPFSIFAQLCVFFHTALGVIAAVSFGVWILSHWLGGRRQPRTARKICAYVGFWLFAVSTLTGFILTWEAALGLYLSRLWYWLHLLTGIAALPFLVYHLWPVSQPSPGSGITPTELGGFRRSAWTTVFLLTIVLFAASAGLSSYCRNLQRDELARQQKGAEDFRPSNVNTEHGRPISVQRLANSASCGTSDCHAVIYKEWHISAHRWSAESDFFQAVRTATTRVKGVQETNKCGACHDPVSMLSGHKDPNLGRSSPGHKEGDSCVVCHAIRKVDERGIGSYVLGEPAPYLFDWSDGRRGRFLNHFLVRAYPRQHNRDYDLALVRKPESCAPCHKEYDVLNEAEGPVQVETQFDDWKQGKWNTDSDVSRRLYCQQCHMPLLQTARHEADPYNLKRGHGVRHRDHSFPAANQYMPAALQVEGAKAHIARVEEWLRGERVLPEIDKIWPRGPLMELKIAVPESVKAGDELQANLTLTNRKVGHGFPTGPLNIARAWIEILVEDPSGKNVFHSGLLDDKNHIEDGTFVLKPLAINTSGQMILKPDLWHPVGPQFRRAVLAQESDTYLYKFRIPAGTKGPLSVRARLRYSKANQFFMDAVYPDMQRRAPITDIAKSEARIEVR